MPICQHCNHDIDEQARFCPNCGKPAGGTPSHPPEVAALLTSANLHRLAGEWDLAIADVSDAFRLNPTDAEVASLMVTVCEQKQDLDEAAIWAKLACELDPENASHKVKLQRISDELAVRKGLVARQAKTQGRKWSPLHLAIAVAAVLLIVVIAWAMRPSRGRQTVEQHVAPSSGIPKVITPESRIAQGGQRQGGTSNQSLSGQESTTSGSGSRTPAEVAIRAAANADQAVQSIGAQVDDVVADPRHGVVTITFLMPAGSMDKSRILTSAAAVARAAFAANTEVAFVTARCMATPAGSRSTQVAFVGDITRANAQALPVPASAQQYAAAFTAAWWNPQVR